MTLFSQTKEYGNQIWMTSNLDVTHYQNGDPIPASTSQSFTRLKEGAYCIYEGEKLYNWYALSDPRGLAPKGYHLPTYSEWMELLFFLNVPMSKKGVLKNSGFYRHNTGMRDMLGYGGYKNGFSSWWCIDDVDKWDAYHCWVYDLKAAYVTSLAGHKGNGMSVRCIKNKQ